MRTKSQCICCNKIRILPVQLVRPAQGRIFCKIRQFRKKSGAFCLTGRRKGWYGMKNNAFVWSRLMKPEKTGRRCVLILLILLAAVFFLSFLLGRYRVSALQTARLLADRALSGVSRGHLRLAPTWTPEEASVVIQIRLPRILSAALIGRGALCRGRVVSGHVPQPHGVARSAGRVDRRVLRCGAGDSARRELRRHHGGLVPLRACGGGTDVSGRGG